MWVNPRVPIPGADDSPIQVITVHEAITNDSEGIRRAVVWDEGGGQEGVSAAEMLVDRGIEVQVVTPAFAVAEDVHLTMRIPLYKRLLSLGTTFTPNNKVARLEGQNVVLRNIYSQQESRIADVDLLVAWMGNRVNDQLRTALKKQVAELHLIGDCLAPRLVESAMTEGAKVARALP